MAKKRPKIEDRRGLDLKWKKVTADFTIFAVLAPCEKVVRAYARVAGEFKSPSLECLSQQLQISGDDWERAVFAFQFWHSPWTHIQSLSNRVGWSDAEELSHRLKTQLLAFCNSDTAGVFGHFLYDNGRCVEEFSCGDTPEFTHLNRAERLAAGWQLSDNNFRQLRSERLGKLDMNSPGVIKLSDQVARDLDCFVPCWVWTVNPKSGKVEVEKPWKRSDFVAARLLMAKW